MNYEKTYIGSSINAICERGQECNEESSSSPLPSPSGNKRKKKTTKKIYGCYTWSNAKSKERKEEAQKKDMELMDE